MNLIKRPLIYIPVLVLLVAGATGAYFMFFANQDPIPQSIRSQVSFALLYPGSLPSGWSIDKSSFYVDSSEQVVGYRLKGQNGYLGVTIQPTPNGFNFNDFYTKRLANTAQFLTPLGQGAIGKADNNFIGSLDTPSSWVLTSSSSNAISKIDIQYVLSHMQVVTPKS
jgi:hypothetical protein